MSTRALSLFRGAAAPYAEILAPPGRRTTVAAGWIGRFPKSALGLALILMVSLTSGSYAVAGAVSAVFVLSLAVGGPQWSRAMDRFGQPRILVIASISLLFTSALLVSVIMLDLPVWTWFAAAALSGASIVDIGSTVRARWSAVLAPERRMTAFALESINDELVFVVSPPLVTVLAALVHPALGFAVGLGFGITGSLVLARQPGAPVTLQQHDDPPRSRSVPWRVGGIVVAFVGMGTVFGSFDVTVVALSTAAGMPAATGLLIGLFAVASVVAGAVLGARRPARRRDRAFLIAAVAYALVVPTLALADSVPLTALLCLAAGAVTSPLIITGLALVEERADPRRLTETLAYPAAGLAIGGMLGALFAGILIDAGGAALGFLVSAAAALSVVTTAAISEGLVRRVAGRGASVGGVRRM